MRRTIVILIILVMTFTVFCGCQTRNTTLWFSHQWDDSFFAGELTLSEFPNARFNLRDDRCSIAMDGQEILSGMPIWNCYASDLNGDGYRELCCHVSLGSGVVSEHIAVYDIHNEKTYTMGDRGVYDYSLCLQQGKLTVSKMDYKERTVVAAGELKLVGEVLVMA